MNIQNVDVSVRVNGRPVREHLFQGKFFLEAREGTEYSVRIQNNNWHRVMVVCAVDGLNVLNGKPASSKDAGYVVPAYGAYEIKGYRNSSDTVGAFKFVARKKSYAQQKGMGGNVGIIAVAVYREKQKNWNAMWYSPPVEWQTLNIASPIPCVGTATDIICSVSPQSLVATNGQVTPAAGIGAFVQRSITTENFCSSVVGQGHVKNEGLSLGTTWGQKIEDRVVETEFDGEDSALAHFEFIYDARENLEAMGIKIVPEKLVAFPKGFPRDYADAPSGWHS